MNYTEFRRRVFERDNGRCCRCGATAQTLNHRNHHHRDNRASNAHAACGDGTVGCHGYIEHHRTDAKEWGWSVHSSAPVDTEKARIWQAAGLYGRGWYLVDDGFGITYLGAE